MRKVLGMTVPTKRALVALAVVGLVFSTSFRHNKVEAGGGVQVGNKKMEIELVKADSNEFLNLISANLH